MSSFPWKFSGHTFKSRSDLERSIEDLASGGTRAHVHAAAQLLKEAKDARTLSSDQVGELKQRLHL